jgi:hypothetical protein
MLKARLLDPPYLSTDEPQALRGAAGGRRQPISRRSIRGVRWKEGSAKYRADLENAGGLTRQQFRKEDCGVDTTRSGATTSRQSFGLMGFDPSLVFRRRSRPNAQLSPREEPGCTRV